MIGLYKFYWDCGRQGDVEGLFLADDVEVNAKIGREVYFGEILGKHSEVYGTLEPQDIQLISNDPVVVKIFQDHNISSGHNPLHYAEEVTEDSGEPA